MIRQLPIRKQQLSPRQQHILRFITDFYAARGYPPTIREIQGHLKPAASGKPVSTSVVDYNLNILEERHHIRRNRHISRGIELVNPPSTGSNRVTIPLVGQIAAGLPIEVPEGIAEFKDTIELGSDLLPKRTDDLFALRVRGKSMIDALIDDNDIVILRPQVTAENGEMVAVWLRSEKETTLKKFYHEGARVRLQPCNSLMDPLFYRADNVEIKGKVVAVHRQLD